MVPKINLRRLTECNQCDRFTPVRGNVKQHDDETDTAQLCQRCERQLRAEASVMLALLAHRPWGE